MGRKEQVDKIMDIITKSAFQTLYWRGAKNEWLSKEAQRNQKKALAEALVDGIEPIRYENKCSNIENKEDNDNIQSIFRCNKESKGRY